MSFSVLKVFTALFSIHALTTSSALANAASKSLLVAPELFNLEIGSNIPPAEHVRVKRANCMKETVEEYMDDEEPNNKKAAKVYAQLVCKYEKIEDNQMKVEKLTAKLEKRMVKQNKQLTKQKEIYTAMKMAKSEITGVDMDEEDYDYDDDY